MRGIPRGTQSEKRRFESDWKSLQIKNNNHALRIFRAYCFFFALCLVFCSFIIWESARILRPSLYDFSNFISEFLVIRQQQQQQQQQPKPFFSKTLKGEKIVYHFYAFYDSNREEEEVKTWCVISCWRSALRSSKKKWSWILDVRREGSQTKKKVNDFFTLSDE